MHHLHHILANPAVWAFFRSIGTLAHTAFVYWR